MKMSKQRAPRARQPMLPVATRRRVLPDEPAPPVRRPGVRAPVPLTLPVGTVLLEPSASASPTPTATATPPDPEKRQSFTLSVEWAGMSGTLTLSAPMFEALPQGWRRVEVR
jgi:hypothetical protein